ncbi:MAG: tRNA-dihydrouridine synthase family protein [Clostridiaceae bacterium]|nr:tRNA-dihydrouridine synthase family protein [Clostridiaceae bacterium]
MKKRTIRPISYAGVEIDSNLALAPIAGTTSWPFRLICQEQGASWAVTELVSASGIRYDPELRRQYRYLAIEPRERRTAIQLFSAKAEDVDYAVRHILERPSLNRTAFIDLNFGCPVKKVVKTGAGSALLDTPVLAVDLCRTAVLAAENYGKQVTVKIRSGCKKKMKDITAFVRQIEAVGIAAIVVHPRLAAQMYGGRADWNVIREIKEAVSIPVIGNGDLISPQSVQKMADFTGADGFMIGRAARGNPWIFSDIRGYFAELKAGDEGDEGAADAVRSNAEGIDTQGASDSKDDGNAKDKAARIAVCETSKIAAGETSKIAACETTRIAAGSDVIAAGREAKDEAVCTNGRDQALRTMVNDPVTGHKISLWQLTIRQHLRGLAELMGEEQAVREMRKQLICYTRGLPGASALRPRLMEVLTVTEVEELVNMFGHI